MEANNKIAAALATSDPVIIGKWTFYADTLLLECDEKKTKLEPRSAYLLYYLAEKAGDPVSRDELTEKVWSGMVVGDEALTGAINKLRNAFGDDSHHPAVIKTIPKVGYQLIVDVEFSPSRVSVDNSNTGTDKKYAFAGFAVIGLLIIAGAYFLLERPGTSGESTSRETTVLELPDKPSIAVLPLTNMTGDSEQDFFSDGLSEDIITTIAQYPNLFVIARHSAWVYKDKQIKASQVGQELGVQYVLEGSVQQAGDVIRINVQLIDATTDHHIWAKKYDSEAQDYFELRDSVVQEIATTIGGSSGIIRHVAGQSAVRKDPRYLNAHEYFLKGKTLYRLYTREGIEQARKTFQDGIEKYPDYPTLYPPLGWMHYWDLSNGWSEDPEKSADEGLRLARKALSYSHATPEARFLAHWLVGKLSMWKHRDYELSLAEYDKAEMISPNEPDLKASKSEILTWAGKSEEALESVRGAMRLNPHYPVWYRKWLGFALYNSGQYQEAINVLKPIDKDWGDMLRWRAACYVNLGKLDEARLEIKKLLELNSRTTLSSLEKVLPYDNKQDLERELMNLRKAGLPE